MGTLLLEQAQTDLRRELGDVLHRDAGGRGPSTGIFALEVVGPGSVPALADLDVPELCLDLLPGTALEALSGLGYLAQPDGSWQHPQGWRLVLAEEGSGAMPRQVALRALLAGGGEAAAQYRVVFQAQGRAAADVTLWPDALNHHIRTVGFAPALCVAEVMRGLDVPWMLAGGWALDAFHGTVTRPHEDVDVIVPRSCQLEVRDVLAAAGWRLDACVEGGYAVWSAPLEPPVHQVHARHPGLPGALLLDLLLTDMDAQTWVYRRDPTLTLPLSQARLVGAHGLPHLAPEAVLLFKSRTTGRDPRGKDEQDFARTLPALKPEARRWLAAALDRTAPEYPWRDRLGVLGR